MEAQNQYDPRYDPRRAHKQTTNRNKQDARADRIDKDGQYVAPTTTLQAATDYVPLCSTEFYGVLLAS
jgi:hypothetical protein